MVEDETVKKEIKEREIAESMGSDNDISAHHLQIWSR